MQLHGSGSPKRTMFMGNLQTMGLLDKGKLTAKERKKRTKTKTTRTMPDVATKTMCMCRYFVENCTIKCSIHLN